MIFLLVILAREVVTTRTTETDLAHVSAPHHGTAAVAPHGTDTVPRPQVIVITTTIDITTAIVVTAAAVGMIDITAPRQDTTPTDTTLPLTDTTITIVIIIIIIIKNSMTSHPVVGENPELLYFISFCNNTIHLLMPF